MTMTRIFKTFIVFGMQRLQKKVLMRNVLRFQLKIASCLYTNRGTRKVGMEMAEELSTWKIVNYCETTLAQLLVLIYQLKSRVACIQSQKLWAKPYQQNAVRNNMHGQKFSLRCACRTYRASFLWFSNFKYIRKHLQYLPSSFYFLLIEMEITW